jgi:hypothetical protein
MQNNVSTLIGAVAVIVIVFITFNVSNDDFLFDQYYEQASVYEWEMIDDLTDDEIYDFLIDYTSLEEYDSIEDENVLEWIETINLGG